MKAKKKKGQEKHIGGFIHSAAASLPEMAAKRHKIQIVTFVLFVVVYEGHEGIPEYQNWRSVLVVEGSPSSCSFVVRLH